MAHQMVAFPTTAWSSIDSAIFYGATVHGGTDDDGCVYKSAP